MSLDRREFFVILGACSGGFAELFAQHHDAALHTAIDFDSYKPRALTVAQYRLLDTLSEILLPADDSGPGAHDAHVNYYLDVMLYYSTPAKQESWRRGIESFNRLAAEQVHRDFASCSPAEQVRLVSAVAANEMSPSTELEHFFVEWKETTITAFYLSDLVQREHLGYTGNTAIPEFKGCPHHDPSHSDRT
jgi:hypothetical protein